MFYLSETLLFEVLEPPVSVLFRYFCLRYMVSVLLTSIFIVVCLGCVACMFLCRSPRWFRRETSGEGNPMHAATSNATCIMPVHACAYTCPPLCSTLSLASSMLMGSHACTHWPAHKQELKQQSRHHLCEKVPCSRGSTKSSCFAHQVWELA